MKSGSNSQNDPYAPSVVSLSEFGVKPAKEQQFEIIHRFEELLDRLNIEVFTIDKQAAKKSYELRALYPSLKGMDAFQLAVSINENCGVFITNDKSLKKVTAIPVKTLDDLI